MLEEHKQALFKSVLLRLPANLYNNSIVSHPQQRKNFFLSKPRLVTTHFNGYFMQILNCKITYGQKSTPETLFPKENCYFQIMQFWLLLVTKQPRSRPSKIFHIFTCICLIFVPSIRALVVVSIKRYFLHPNSCSDREFCPKITKNINFH